MALFLPEGILDYFQIVSYRKSSSVKHIYDKQLELTLEEKDIIPSEYQSYPYRSSGFMEARYIDNYPIRNMLVKLKVRRRRWEITINSKKKQVSRNWEVIAQGTRMSEEYAAFLKEISRF
ncbi:ISAon1 family transposase N-terminal region protein [Saccharicrinis fermentans]